MSNNNEVVELKEEDLEKVSGGCYYPGETLFTYCPYCYGVAHKNDQGIITVEDGRQHLVISWWDDLECLTCHNHHRLIDTDEGGHPYQYDLNAFYNEIGFIPPKP